MVTALQKKGRSPFSDCESVLEKVAAGGNSRPNVKVGGPIIPKKHLDQGSG